MIQKFFNLFANTKNSNMLKKWEIAVNVLLTLIFLVSIISSGFGQQKVNNYMATYYSYNNITSIIQHTTEIIYLSRKLNILSYQNMTEDLPMIINKLNDLKGLVTTERDIINPVSWPASLPSY